MELVDYAVKLSATLSRKHPVNRWMMHVWGHQVSRRRNTRGGWGGWRGAGGAGWGVATAHTVWWAGRILRTERQHGGARADILMEAGVGCWVEAGVACGGTMSDF